MNKVTIFPYYIKDGIPTLSDSEVKYIYNRIADEGKLNSTFYDGDINSADDFLNAMKGNYNYLYLVYYDNDLAGIFWLNRIKGKSAYLHFYVFKSHWGKNSFILGTESLKYIMNFKVDNEYLFDVLFGLTPYSNRLACRWIQKVGLKPLVIIPKGIYNYFNNQMEPAVLSQFERQEDENI